MSTCDSANDAEFKPRMSRCLCNESLPSSTSFYRGPWPVARGPWHCLWSTGVRQYSTPVQGLEGRNICESTSTVLVLVLVNHATLLVPVVLVKYRVSEYLNDLLGVCTIRLTVRGFASSYDTLPTLLSYWR
jgi:hypothetical protein